MTTIKRLRLKDVPPTLTPETQCQQHVDDMDPYAKVNRKAAWRVRNAVSRGLAADRCWRLATVEIKGKRLCDQHAGLRALEILLNEGHPYD